MLWQLLQGSGYGAYQTQESTFVRTGPKPLDPIHIAGGTNVRLLLKSAEKRGALFATLLLSIIIDPQGSLMRDIAQDGRSIRFTNKKYAGHFDDLAQWKLLEETAPEDIRYFNTYFGVPKSEEVDRAIFNGKNLSKLCPTPPPVNLADITRIIEEIGTCNCHKGLWFVMGDIRHWFHQLPVSEALSRYFGLALGEKCFRWTCLPMGWSYSPAIAQAAAWTMLAHREDEEPAYIFIDGLENSPAFLPLFNSSSRRVGTVFLYYDNYLVVSECPATAQAMHIRIMRNARLFSIILKEHALIPRSALLGPTPPVFLGMEISLDYKRGRDASPTHRLRWRPKPRKIEQPTMLVWAARSLAAIIGQCLFCRLVSLQPLGSENSTRQVLSILRRTSKEAWRTTWNTAMITLRPEELTAIQDEVVFATSRVWHYAVAPPTSWGYVASDASSEMWGFVFYDETGSVTASSGPRVFPPDIKENHIFIKELYAAIEGCKAQMNLSPFLQRIHIAVDNTAVAAVLRRRYSSNMKATSMMAALTIDLRVVIIPSAANVADSPSRGSPLELHRITDTWNAFKADSDGLRLGSAPRHPNNQTGRLRHSENEDESEEGQPEAFGELQEYLLDMSSDDEEDG
jgi:hypothetical protein